MLVDVQQLEEPLPGQVVELDTRRPEQVLELLVTEDVVERLRGPALLANEDERIGVRHARCVMEQPDHALHLRRNDLAAVEGHEPEPVHPVLLADESRIAQPPPEVNNASLNIRREAPIVGVQISNEKGRGSVPGLANVAAALARPVRPGMGRARAD